MADDGWNSDDGYVAPIAVNKNYDNRGNQRTFVRKQTYVQSNWRHKDNDNDAEKLEVKTSLVGRIIGRGGAQIKELQTQSDSRIKVVKSYDNPDITEIIIYGNKDAKIKAKEMIEKLIEVRPTEKRRPFVNNSEVESVASGPTSNDCYDEPLELEPIDWQARYRESVKIQEAYWATLPPIYKDFYKEDPEIAGMPKHEVEQWRKMNNNISVQRIEDDSSIHIPKIPNPVHQFEQAFGAYPEILDAIRQQGFTTPSPIQAQAWPILLSGQDLIGIAQTGTGKTLAFLLPALIHIDNQPTPLHERAGPNVLVLAPTRELAIQIEREVKKYPYKNYKTVCIYGGASRQDQIEVVANGVQIVIATPGRLNDLVKAGHINVEAVTYLVLDEADRMLDMGFGPQIRVSLLKIRPTRQTVMTSATWPFAVQVLGQSYMKNPVQVVVGTLDLAAVHTVTQELLFVNDNIEEKFAILIDFLKAMDPEDKVIVFCGRRATASSISADVALLGIKSQSIFGGLDQCDREQALDDMRSGEVNILIATDIASRGIDIENITHIINFDFPHNLEEFVHRVGRTGRAGRTGKAITYISRYDWANAEGLIDILQEADQEVPDELVRMAERFKRKALENPGRGRGRGGGGRGRGGGGRRSDNFY